MKEELLMGTGFPLGIVLKLVMVMVHNSLKTI